MTSHPDLLVGFSTGDDAAVYRVRDDLCLVLTVDFFPPIVDDPFDYGAIAVANSLSDVYAMGGTPILGLNIVCFPVGLPHTILHEILRGGAAVAQEAGVLIAGGHTIDDTEPKYGLAVTGVVEPGRHVTNASAKEGDRLVLTKPLGTGIITTAAKQGVAEPALLQRAVAIMKALNREAAQAMTSVGASACTDITGFGLIGHLNAMMTASKVTARLDLSRIPVIEGTWELARKGVVPGGTRRNLESVGALTRWHSDISENARLVLCDAQTSGGLLISVPGEKLEALRTELRARGVDHTVIGQVVARADIPVVVDP